MEVQKDFKELLASFNAHGVEYLIVVGYAQFGRSTPIGRQKSLTFPRALK
jgi:hypothetical protein